MFRKVFRLVRFIREPHSLSCPKCGVAMTWNPAQGPGTGGWKCPKCGLKIDYKG